MHVRVRCQGARCWKAFRHLKNGFGRPGPNDFENDATATAPAQRVDITDQLAATLDWNTFQITEIGFGDTLLTIPPGTQHYQTTVAMTYNGKTFNVLIEVGLRFQIGQVFAVFQSIDPATDLPPDILTGFLPPENGTGRGQGHISYTIRPKSNLTTGTQIRNIALVTFDLGETIATDQKDDHDPTKGTGPAKEALVTIDAVPPASRVQTLPALTRTPSFLVQWSGQDDMGGSGLAFFDIYVSDDGGPFRPWLTRTTLTQAMFTGQDGHTYGFYSAATDYAGNREADPAAAQATTKLYTADHFSVLAMPNPAAAGVAFQLTVRALDVNGNPATAYTGTVHLSSSIGADQLPADYTFLPGEQGVHVFTITLTLSGTRTITVRDTATATIAGMVSVQVNPAAARSFVVAGFPTSVVAGTPGGFTVTALDRYGNVATGYHGTVHFVSSDGQADLPDDTVLVNGMGSFSATLKTAGTQAITATDTADGSITGAQADIIVTPAASDHFGIAAPQHHRAGRAFTLTITALDPYGNVDVNYLGTITFSSSDPQAMLPDDVTFTSDDQGRIVLKHGTTLFTAGSQTILATDVDTGLLSGSATVTVNPAAADHFQVNAPAHHRAGRAFAVTVTALDPYGNIATRYTGSITFTTSDLGDGVVLPDDYTFTANDMGVHRFPGVVLVTAGDQTITVTDIDTGLLSGSATVTIRGGPTPFAHNGWNLDAQDFPVVGFPSWALVPRFPEVPALDAGPIGAPRADEARSFGGTEVASFPIALVESEEASRPKALARSAAARADDVWLDAFRELWFPCQSLLETRREDGEEA